MKKHTGSVLFLFLLVSLLASSCSGLKGMENTPVSPSNPGGELPVIHQWAEAANASSEFGNSDWAASQAVGVPDVFECGDNKKAWASEKNDTIEWIELSYKTPVYPTEINVYQNFNPSQVVEIQMIGTDGSKYIAWQGYSEKVTICPDQMTVTVDAFKKVGINKLRITIDQRVSGWGWNEIDAVEMVGSIN